VQKKRGPNKGTRTIVYPDPSEKEILLACWRIRRGWDSLRRKSARVFEEAEPWTPPEVPSSIFLSHPNNIEEENNGFEDAVKILENGRF
jgi:hypothetical protein